MMLWGDCTLSSGGQVAGAELGEPLEDDKVFVVQLMPTFVDKAPDYGAPDNHQWDSGTESHRSMPAQLSPTMRKALKHRITLLEKICQQLSQ